MWDRFDHMATWKLAAGGFGLALAAAAPLDAWWRLGLGLAVIAGAGAMGWRARWLIPPPEPQTELRPAMVPIPAGEFTMGGGWYGDEKPRHPVLLLAFWMAETVVTQAHYAALMGDNPSSWLGDDLPVEQVSWFDAVRYCNALSAREHRTPAYRIAGESVTLDQDAAGYRLPIESEWEYACRAGTQTEYSSGDDESDLARVGWYGSNSGGRTHPVKERESNRNPWGLYDMHGNVWEWCEDVYRDYLPGPQTDSQGPDRGVEREFRGGSLVDSAGFARSAYRSGWWPGGRLRSLGFRPVFLAPDRRL